MSVNADVKTRSGPKPIDTTTKSKTGIKVLIVGAGFGGLTAAIECHLQGHSVTVLEAVKQLKPFGDGISFGANAGRIFGSWSKGYMLKRFLGHLNYYEYFDIRKYDGTRIVKQPPPERIPDAPTINGHRGEMHMEMYYYAKDILGIDIRCGCKVLKYFEDEDGAGVELGNGERITGDVVIGSDGVKSLARKLLGYDDKPHSSGYAIFRTCFAAEEMLDDPLTREFVDYGDTFTGWAGPNVHFLFVVSKGGQMASWFLTHLDSEDIPDESWSFPGKLEDAIEVIKDWDPTCRAILEKTPEDALIDFKLVYRDPLPSWISKGGRIALLGDAAHPFLPTSMQGASQAMEDGVTLAICLRHAGKQNIPLALKIYERIRYDRVRRVQKMGESTRDQWHKADWDAVMKDPTLVQLPYPDYILKFNSHLFAEENYERVAEEVRQGRTLRDFDDEEHLKKMTKNSVDEVQMTPAAL